MKRINYLMLAIVFILQLAACSGQDRVVRVNDLPQTAQKLISTHFVGKQVSLVKKDVELTHVSYDVVLNDRTKLEFNSNGEWKEIDCKTYAVPQALVPSAIAEYVKNNHYGMQVVKIDRKGSAYEIELSNGLEIKFNKHFKVLEMDD